MSEHATPAGRAAKFALGHILITPGGIVAVEFNRIQPIELLRRHITGDWGDLFDEDKRLNDEALEHGGRILSAYVLADGQKVWILTEADRSATTILTPDEY